MSPRAHGLGAVSSLLHGTALHKLRHLVCACPFLHLRHLAGRRLVHRPVEQQCGLCGQQPGGDERQGEQGQGRSEFCRGPCTGAISRGQRRHLAPGVDAAGCVDAGACLCLESPRRAPVAFVRAPSVSLGAPGHAADSAIAHRAKFAFCRAQSAEAAGRRSSSWPQAHERPGRVLGCLVGVAGHACTHATARSVGSLILGTCSRHCRAAVSGAPRNARQASTLAPANPWLCTEVRHRCDIVCLKHLGPKDPMSMGFLQLKRGHCLRQALSLMLEVGCGCG